MATELRRGSKVRYCISTTAAMELEVTIIELGATLSAALVSMAEQGYLQHSGAVFARNVPGNGPMTGTHIGPVRRLGSQSHRIGRV